MSALADRFAAQLARFWPFGKRPEGPLGSLKTAARWLENLPLGDAFKCQELIAAELKRFNGSSIEYTRDRLGILMLVDEKSRDVQDTLTRQYLRNPRMPRAHESRLWHAVYGLYWEVARGYYTFARHLARETGKAPHDGALPLVTLRAIRAFGQLLKWRAVRYVPAGEKLWLRLHTLYQIAESGGFHRRLLRGYADDASDGSCERAYLHILMLNLADSGTLYPRQIDLLDRWLCGWHETLQLDSQFDASTHHFSVELTADHGPRRARIPARSHALRFWATAGLLQKLQDIQAALQQGRHPAQLGLTEAARVAESLELLTHLLHRWAPLASREQRRAPRESIKRMIDVTHGLAAIVTQITAAAAPASASPYGAGLNYTEVDDVEVYGFVTDRTRARVSHMQVPAIAASPEVERWIIHDESECGYGAVVESRDKDWLRVGALVGVKPHDAAQWTIGIVRRLSRVDDDTCSLGIETLAATAAPTTLYETPSSSHTVAGTGNSKAGLPAASLWLSGGAGGDTAIIDPIHFVPDKVFEVDGIPERQFIALGKPIEHGEGWLHVAVVPVVS